MLTEGFKINNRTFKSLEDIMDYLIMKKIIKSKSWEVCADDEERTRIYD